MKRPAKAPGQAMPEFIQPCLATLTKRAPITDQWVHEIKLDGYRLQAHLSGGDVRLVTRKGLDWTERFAGLATALAKLKVRSAILDGEAVVEDDRGVSSFVALVDDLKAGGSKRMIYVAFDMLYLDGTLLTDQSLGDRKSLLETALGTRSGKGAIRYSQHLSGDGPTILKEACKLGLEGIVSKRIDLPYRSGRSDSWLKAKCLQSDEFVIVGYVDSTAIKNAIGALALGYYDKDRLMYAGRVGTGFTRATAAEIWQNLQPLRLKASPLAASLTALQRRGVAWVKPMRVAQVNYAAVTGDKLLRHASFIALREDKPAREIEAPASFRA